MDLSKLSDADLEALNSGDLTKVSDAGLSMLQAEAPKAPAQEQTPQEPGMLGKLAGAGQVAYDLASEHPVLAGAAATGAATLMNKIPGVGTAAQKVAGAVVPQPLKTIANAIPTAFENWQTNNINNLI